MDVAPILVDLFILFAAARAAGELFESLRQPAVIGELLAGVIVGPHVLGFVGVEGEEVLEVVAELGVIILLFTVGLETTVGQLRRVGRSAFLVGVLGVVLPLVTGTALVLGFGRGREEALFVAAAMVATSVGITARVLRDLRAVTSPPARVVLAAAVVDDILAVIVLSVVAGLAADDLSSVDLIGSVAGVAVFLVAVLWAGPPLLRRLSALAHTPLVPRSPFVFAVLVTLGLAALSGTLGLATIIGAFVAGVIFEFSREEIATQIEPVGEFLIPFFFAVTGSRLDPAIFADAEVLGAAAAVSAVAILTKLLAGRVGAASLGRLSAWTVGVGMVPRGEVGFIVASLGLGLGVISSEMFGVVLAMTVVTTLATPPVLSVLTRRLRRAQREEREG